VELSQADNDAALLQWRRQVEHARYETQRAERRYRAVDPENRLVARGVETAWEKCLQDLHAAESELANREQQRPRVLSDEDRAAIRSLGGDVSRVWSARTTTDRDRKELLRSVLEEVIITIDREQQKAHLALRWRGELIDERDVELRRCIQPPNRTDEETVELVRRLAVHYSDAVIAGILNRQKRTTATGMSFTASRVCSLRTHWGIARVERRTESDDGELDAVHVRLGRRKGLRIHVPDALPGLFESKINTRGVV
jgi:hypothetical protein